MTAWWPLVISFPHGIPGVESAFRGRVSMPAFSNARRRSSSRALQVYDANEQVAIHRSPRRAFRLFQKQGD
jgi:hypothetical protein